MLTEISINLSAGPVRLRFDKIVTFEPGGELVPYYHYKVVDGTNATVGHINFRVGNTRHVNMVAGHIGFEVAEQHRGQSYARHACIALIPLIKRHHDEVILTADPDNVASIRTIERLWANYLSEIEVPFDDPAYAGGARRKRRFEWTIPDVS